MQKKTVFIVSFSLLLSLAIGQVSFAAISKEKPEQGNTANETGMTEMMQNANMGKMMESMNSPEGMKMMQACGDFMKSYEKTKNNAVEKNESV